MTGSPSSSADGAALALVALLAVIAATVFNQGAQDVARWIACGYGEPCGSAARQLEAESLGVLTSSLYALVGFALAASATALPRIRLITGLAGILAAALFALLKVVDRAAQRREGECAAFRSTPPADCIATGAPGHYDVDIFAFADEQLTIFLLVAFSLMALAAVARSAKVLLPGAAQSVLLRAVVGLTTGAAIGLAWQGGVQALSHLIGAGIGTSQFLITPTATVAAASFFVAALPFPFRRNQGDLILAVALGLLATAAWIYYAVEQWPDDDERRAIGAPLQIAVVGLLMLPGLVVTGGFGMVLGWTARIAITMVLISAAAGAVGAVISSNIVYDHRTDTVLFVLAHAGANALVPPVVALTIALLGCVRPPPNAGG